MNRNFNPARVPDKTKAMAVVTYSDERTAYVRVPKSADPSTDLLTARKCQQGGEIPPGDIVSVKRAR